MKNTVFQGAITGEDGEVDAGYLALFWIMAVVITAIPFMCVFAMVAMWLDAGHHFDVQSLGIGIGSVCTGFGVAVGAVGAFRMGDKPRVPAVPPMPTTTTRTETTTTAAAPQTEPLQVAVVDMPPADPPAPPRKRVKVRK